MARFKVIAGAAIVRSEKGERFMLRGTSFDGDAFETTSLDGLLGKGMIAEIKSAPKPAAKSDK